MQFANIASVFAVLLIAGGAMALGTMVFGAAGAHSRVHMGIGVVLGIGASLTLFGAFCLFCLLIFMCLGAVIAGVVSLFS